MKTSLTFFLLLSTVYSSLGLSPLDSVSFNLGSHIRNSIDELDYQSVVVKTYETANDGRLDWSKFLSLEWNTYQNGLTSLEKRHIAFWFQRGDSPLADRFSMAFELPHQAWSREPVVVQINGYSNVVEFVSSIVKAKSKMDQWMELAFGKEITNLVKRIPSISYSLSDITDAMSRSGGYYIDDKSNMRYDYGFQPVPYDKIEGFNVHGAFFFTMVINAKPDGRERHPGRNKFKPFLVISTEKRYLKYVADSWGELQDGTCVLSESTTKRIVADNTVLIPKTLISYDDVIKLIPLLNPKTAARELQQLRQQHSKDSSVRKKAGDLFR